MMEAVRTSETSVDNHFTRQYISEDNSEHHTRRRENLKSHILAVSLTRTQTKSGTRQETYSKQCVDCIDTETLILRGAKETDAEKQGTNDDDKRDQTKGRLKLRNACYCSV
jgi:hypothetical protein